MIKINNKISQLIDNITTLYLAKGVQPSELAEAVFNDNYKSLEIKKKAGKIQLFVDFVEEDNLGRSLIKMRYTYDEKQRLLCIEQKINTSRYISQWDRRETMEGYMTQLEQEFKALNSADVVDKVLKSLPKDLVRMILPKLKLVM
jgi:hypothetical protein